MNTLKWSKKSLRQLKKLSAQDSKTIYRTAQTLKHFPDCQNVKRLSHHEYNYRLRIGNFRVLFDYDGKVNIVSIEEVKKRNESTYSSTNH